MKHPNAGAPWTEVELLSLLERFDAGQPLEELVAAHGRTPNSLVSALERAGRLVVKGKAYYAVSAQPFVTFTHIREIT